MYFFLRIYSPINKKSILYLRKHNIASFGEFTIGWPLILNEVLRITGIFEKLKKQISREKRIHRKRRKIYDFLYF